MDIYKIKDTLSTKRFRDTFCAVLVVLFITAEMFVSAANDWDGRLDIINLIGITSKVLFVIIVLRNIPCKSFAVKVYGAFLVWLIVTRPFCRDVTFDGSHGIIIKHIVFFCVLNCFSSGKEKLKKGVFVATSAVYCLFYLAISIALIYISVMHGKISILINIDVGVLENAYVNVLSRNRNITAQWVCIAFCLALCLRVVFQEKKIVRFLISLLCVCFYVALGTTLSRASFAAAAASLAVAVAIYLTEYLKNKKHITYTIVPIFIALIVFVGSYKGFNVTNALLSKVSERTYVTSTLDNHPVDEDTNSVVVSDSAETVETAEEKSSSVLKDTRDTENIRTMNARSTIWYATIGSLTYEPYRLKFGDLPENYMTAINMKIANMGKNWETSHAHNSALEVLMMTGVVGFVFILVFLILLLVRMMCVFFSKKASIFGKMLILPVAATIVKNMFESTLVRHEDVTNYIFFLVAGIFLSYSYELFPEKKRWGRRKGKAQSANDASSTAIDEAAAKQTLAEQVTL